MFSIRHSILLLGLAGCLGLGACTTSHEARPAATKTAKADPFAGPWAGTWQSSRGSHKGKLECILTPAANSHYAAQFHAHWGAFSSTYEVDLTTQPAPGGLKFQGQQDLGTLQGGVYQYDGTVTPSRFLANYSSKYDTGTFTLSRPPIAHHPKFFVDSVGVGLH